MCLTPVNSSNVGWRNITIVEFYFTYDIYYINNFNFTGLTRWLNGFHGVSMPPSQAWYCTLSVTTTGFASLSSTLFILNMTFERLYSIMVPHKAASFNTVRRAKMTIGCSVMFSFLYNVPQLYTTDTRGKSCVPFGKAVATVGGQIYQWSSTIINFIFPFVFLLIMNSFIIHTIRTRSEMLQTRSTGQGHNSGQGNKINNSEVQIFVILLLVTFGFLALTTPAYAMYFYVMFVDYEQSAYLLAGFSLFYSVAQKAFYTNYGINFFFYVISGS